MDQVPPRLWQLSATDLAKAYGEGLTTPDAVLEAVLARLADVNPILNAVVTLDANGARRSARESTLRWKKRESLSTLDGVPMTIKDNILVRGMRATWGSRLYADFVPDIDEEPVARLREAGAIILGKTNVPELTLHGFTGNALFGPTRNPWNPDLTPGGSSGGAVAAVAAGIGPIALGTDGGGSIRRPAAHTGLIGFKPSRGMVPRTAGFPAILYNLEVAGPVARCVDDIRLVLNVIGTPEGIASPDAPDDIPVRILFIPAFGKNPVDPAIASAVANAAAELSQLGCRVECNASFDLAEPIAQMWPVISTTGVAWLLSQHPGGAERVGPAIAEMARAGAAYTSADYLDALTTIRTLETRFNALFAEFDAILTPTTAAMPWPATESHPTTIAEQPVGPRGHAVFTPFANVLGLPAISLPCREFANGMPVGFQLCAAKGNDWPLLTLASKYEQQTPTTLRWPAL